MLTTRNNVVSVRPEIIAGIRAAKTGPDLYQYLQSAIELEHATIPPYLTALFSIAPNTNQMVAQIIRSVVQQDMLHMTIAANVLNAIGGAPTMNQPGFIPTFPGPLPMSVDGGLIVGLAPLTLNLIETVFMRIELPETPQNFPVRAQLVADQGFNTIGAFYDAIIAQIRVLGDGIFTGNPALQVVDNVWFPADQLFPVTNADTAIQGLTVIKTQGEGTSTDPLDSRVQPAHYYRFEEIVKGYRLVKDPSVEQGYSFSGPPVPFDPTTVINLVSNSTISDYEPGSLAFAGVQQADYIYTSLLNALQQTFSGNPGNLSTTLALMYELKLVVQEAVVNQQLTSGPNAGKFAAPSFQFTPTAAAALAA